MKQNSHEFYMQRALQLAERGRLTVSPNPMVGCVIVKNHQIIAEGWHQRAGDPHAEIYALQQALDQAEDAELYVTLEPCCHYGKTPPCTEAIIRANVKKVYIACLDPNPLVAGKGVHALKQVGIHVELGLCEEEAKALNTLFFHFITHKRPYIIAKWAMSLDGKMITGSCDNRQISHEASLQHSHQVRQQVDAILIGAHTAIKDNPQLTVRYIPSDYQPTRIILTGQTSPPHDLALFHPKDAKKTILATSVHTAKAWLDIAQTNHLTVLDCKATQHQIDLNDLMHKLAELGVSSLLVEGGETVRNQFLSLRLVDKLHVYLSPVLIADFPRKLPLKPWVITPLEHDIFIETTL